MEIKIGIQNITREITLESSQSAEEVTELVRQALDKGGVLDLADDKGRRVLVAAERIGYVDLGVENVRRVGFGAV